MLNESVEEPDLYDWFATPVFATVAYRIPTTFSVLGMRDMTLDVGSTVGWLRLWSAIYEIGGTEYTYAASTIPFLLTGGIQVGSIFTKAGIGLHARTLSADKITGVDDANDNGLNVVITLAGRYIMDISEKFDLKLGAQFINTPANGKEDFANSILGVLVGAQFIF